ncbi:MAG TPA: DUF1284 domain-containing protein [Thermodesulfovibrionales bacterium]|nr:DUF1284 domain-containing protein [Thermodesulfovibrionales bacterium]
MRSIPELRGHHLICLHFFNGKGYSPEFIKNLRAVLRAAAGSGVKVSQGADDVCRACPSLNDGKCMYDEHADEEIQEMDAFALKLLKEAPGGKTEWHLIRERVPGIFPLWKERYCKKCSWEKACEENPLYQSLRRVS